MRRLVGIALCLVAACGKKDDQQPAGEGTASAVARTGDAGVKAAAVIDAGAVAAAPPDAAAAITGIPPLTATHPPGDAVSRSTELGNDALVLHRAGKKHPPALIQAIDTYEEALEVDPAQMVIRYNLASALATQGTNDRALAILAEFRDFAAAQPCATCLERLARARNDGEWKALWKDPRFEEITAAPGESAHVVAFSQVSDRPERNEDALVVRVLLEPAPGYARLPELEVEVLDGGTSSGKTTIAPTREWLSQAFAVRPRPKHKVKVTLTVDGKAYGTLDIDPKVDPDDYAFPEIVRPVRRPPKVARCEGFECPRFPALSADGKTLVGRDDHELLPVGDFCEPDVAALTTYYEVPVKVVDFLEPVASTNLAGFEVLDCDAPVKLPDGFRLEHGNEDGLSASIVDTAGKVVAELSDQFPADDGEFCPSKQHRLIVIRGWESKSDDCDVVGDVRYQVLRY